MSQEIICTENKRLLVFEPIYCQATTWISQLRDATEHNLGDVGRNAEDVEALQQEHEKLEATARVRITFLILWNISYTCISATKNLCKTSNRYHSYERNATELNATERNVT